MASRWMMLWLTSVLALDLLLVSVEAGNTSMELQWGTPIFVHMVQPELAEEFKRGLLEASITLRQQDPQGRTASNRGGWRSASDIHKRKDCPAVIHELKKEMNAAVAAFWKAGLAKTVHTKGKAASPKMYIRDLWMNVLGQGDSNAVHKHGGALFSGVYYVNVPKLPGSGASAAGNLKFRDPRIQTSVYEDLEWMSMGSEVQVAPKEGLMLLWPAWLEHYVEPLAPSSANDGDRQAWAENLLEGAPGSLGSLEISPPESLRIVVPFNVAVKPPDMKS